MDRLTLHAYGLCSLAMINAACFASRTHRFIPRFDNKQADHHSA